MNSAINSTDERINAVSNAIENQEKEIGKAEICFGALMGIAAIAGMWGVVSLMISYFLG